MPEQNWLDMLIFVVIGYFIATFIWKQNDNRCKCPPPSKKPAAVKTSDFEIIKRTQLTNEEIDKQKRKFVRDKEAQMNEVDILQSPDSYVPITKSKDTKHHFDF